MSKQKRYQRVGGVSIFPQAMIALHERICTISLARAKLRWATAPHHQRLARTQRQDNLGTATLLRWLDETLLKGPGEALIGVLVEVLLNWCLPSALLVVASIVMITGFLLWHSLLLVSLVGVLATFLIGCERDTIRGRGYPSRSSTNREATSSTGLARERNRRGRIRDLRAKPAGIWAQADTRK